MKMNMFFAALMMIVVMLISACSQQASTPVQAVAPATQQAAQAVGVDPEMVQQPIQQTQSVITAHPVATAVAVGAAAYMIGKHRARRQREYYNSQAQPLARRVVVHHVYRYH